MEILLAFFIMVGCFAALSLGWILSGKKLRGSCGGVGLKQKGEDIECGVCGKKGSEIEICDMPAEKTTPPADSKKPSKKS